MSEDGHTLVYYRLHWSIREEEGAIFIPVSIWDAESHSSARLEVTKSDADYGFWDWLTACPDYQRRIDEEELEEAKLRFDFESTMTRDP